MPLWPLRCLPCLLCSSAWQAVRNAQYTSYFNLEEAVTAARPRLDAEAAHVTAGARCFDFYRNWRQPRSSIVHFQLRNLLWATSGTY